MNPILDAGPGNMGTKTSSPNHHIRTRAQTEMTKRIFVKATCIQQFTSTRDNNSGVCPRIWVDDGGRATKVNVSNSVHCLDNEMLKYVS